MEEKPEEQNKEAAPKLPKGPYVKTLWMLRAFDRNGNEDNRGDNQEAMAVASQLEATLEKGPASGVILIRDDLDDGSRSTRTTPTVVAFRTGATTNEVVAILRRAIDIALGKYPSQDVLPPQVTDEALADKARRNLIQTWTVPGQQSTEPPTINKNIGPNSLISMKTFAIDGPELLPRGGTWALKHACELAEVIGDNSREMFMLTRKDFTQGNHEVPFVVVLSQKASKEEAFSAFKRAIEILEKPPEAKPEPTKGWAFPSETHEWAVKMRAKEAADKARITAGEGDAFAASEDNILVRQEPACGIGSDLAVGTIRGSKIKSGTKALEKIIKRQQDRIESLAARVGDLTALTGADEINRDRLLKATQSKGMSEALAKVEQMVDCFGVPRIYVNDLVTVKPVKAE